MFHVESGHSKQPYFNSTASRDTASGVQYSTITNVFKQTDGCYTPITNVFKEAGEVKSDRSDEENRKDYLVPILEDEDKKMKHDAMEIIRDFYGITTEVDIWLALQHFDAFIQSRKQADNGKAGHSSNSQKTFKREVSK